MNILKTVKTTSQKQKLLETNFQLSTEMNEIKSQDQSKTYNYAQLETKIQHRGTR